MWRKNVGPVDRAIRMTGGILLLAVGPFLLDGLQGSVVGLVVGALGVWFIITGAIARCPLYVPFGISTLGEERDAAPHWGQGATAH